MALTLRHSCAILSTACRHSVTACSYDRPERWPLITPVGELSALFLAYRLRGRIETTLPGKEVSNCRWGQRGHGDGVRRGLPFARICQLLLEAIFSPAVKGLAQTEEESQRNAAQTSHHYPYRHLARSWRTWQSPTNVGLDSIPCFALSSAVQRAGE